jgi:DNA-binding response OmpR family regulator
MNKKMIAILDDEEDIVEVIKINLEKAGFSVEGFSEVYLFEKFLEKNNPDLIILDVMIPEKNGFEICRDLKKNDRIEVRDIPIIMLTAKGEEIDRVLGLELGSDDYVTKPFSIRELVARVKIIIKRCSRTIEEVSNESKILKIKEDFIIDLEKYECLIDGKETKLTNVEFKILNLLLSKNSKVFSREQILDFLWGDEKSVIDRTIDVHITKLRTKLKKYGKLIENVRGVGYRLKI